MMKKYLITILLILCSTISWAQIDRYIIYQDGVKIDSINAPDTTYVVTGLTASTAYQFYVQAIDVDGDTSIYSNTLNVTTDPEVSCPTITGSTVVTDVSCNGDSDGGAVLTVSGGLSPYSYQWTPSGQTGKNLQNVPAGSYSVLITDANNCTGTANVTINEPAVLAASHVVNNNVLCFSEANGSAIINVTGGTGPYTYNWPIGDDTRTRNDLVAGTYPVEVIDANGCIDSVDVIITEPAELAVAFIESVANVDCFGDSTGVVGITVVGGTTPRDWSFGDGFTQNGYTEDLLTRSNLPAGSYTFQVVDANGCSVNDGFSVLQNSEIIITESILDVTNADSTDGAINTLVEGGDPPYIYLWAPDGETTPNIANKAAGSYTLQVTDELGCIKSEDYIIIVIGQNPENSYIIQLDFKVEINRDGAKIIPL